MGTTVSSLQILGAPVGNVRAALPRALVGQWSARFVTACPELTPNNAERRAKALSRKLNCTLLLVAMFDGDALWLTLYQNGDRLTRHVALPENCWVGSPKVFCSALGLPEELAPKLKRLFTGCEMQEEKLGILQSLLGAPLFLRCSDEKEGHLPEGPIEADAGPLEEWLREHPVPPKVKNRCKAELLQEITDRYPKSESNPIIFRPAVREGDHHTGWYSQHRAGDILGCASRGGEWARFLPDGHMELIPMEDAGIKSAYDNIHVSCLGDRLIMTICRYEPDPSGFPGAQRPFQTVVVRDTAGIIPCPLPLTWEGEPRTGGFLSLPDGGFLIAVSVRYDGSRPPVKIRSELLARYGPDGALRWTAPGIGSIYQITGQRIYAADSERKHLLVLRPNGTVAGKYPLPESPYGTKVHILNGTPFVEAGECGEEPLLYRLTPDLRPDGEVHIPNNSDLALSPDGTLLYAVGYESSLRVIDAKSLDILRDLPRKDSFYAPVVDGLNRLWVADKGCFECHTPTLECISRHRLKGSVYRAYCSTNGHACALTFQESKYITRVYRFT